MNSGLSTAPKLKAPSLQLPTRPKATQESAKNKVPENRCSLPQILLQDEEELMGQIAKLRNVKNTSDKARGPVFRIVRHSKPNPKPKPKPNPNPNPKTNPVFLSSGTRS